MATPSTVTVAASPRDIPVFAITSRTGYSNTSARKMPTKMIRNVSPIATNAAISPRAAATIRTVRIGSSSSMRRGSRDSIVGNVRPAAVGRVTRAQDVSKHTVERSRHTGSSSASTSRLA